jgi:hypothetical protein
VTVV